MNRISATLAGVALVVLAVTGCSSSKSSTSPTTSGPGASSTIATATSVGSPSSFAGATSTTTAAASIDSAAFCTKLAKATEHTSAFVASVGTPDQAAKLAVVTSDNDAILAASPAELRAAITKVHEVAALAHNALDPTLSTSARDSARLAVATTVTKPDVKAAITTYTAWVKAHCGSLTTKILSGGV